MEARTIQFLKRYFKKVVIRSISGRLKTKNVNKAQNWEEKISVNRNTLSQYPHYDTRLKYHILLNVE